MTPNEFANLKSIDRRKQMLNERDAEILQQAFVEAIKECAPIIIADTMPMITKATTEALHTQFEQSIGRAVVAWVLKGLGVFVLTGLGGALTYWGLRK